MSWAELQADNRGDWSAFIRTNTAVLAPPLVPEIRLHLAAEMTPIWQATEDSLEAFGLPPPFWAFAWAGGQALARYVLDHPETVADRRVLDFAAGGGLAGIAALRAGASSVTTAEIDPVAGAAITLNAALNGVTPKIEIGDTVGTSGDWGIVLAGDVCYEQPMAGAVLAWLSDLAAAGTLVLLGDPGRAFLPKSGLEQLIGYSVKTSSELEDTDVRNTSVWRIKPLRPIP